MIVGRVTDDSLMSTLVLLTYVLVGEAYESWSCRKEGWRRPLRDFVRSMQDDPRLAALPAGVLVFSALVAHVWMVAVWPWRLLRLVASVCLSVARGLRWWMGRREGS